MKEFSREDVKRLTEKLHREGLIHSCLTCVNFREKADENGVAEICTLYDVSPPARVIAYGCDSWEDNIPF